MVSHNQLAHRYQQCLFAAKGLAATMLHRLPRFCVAHRGQKAACETAQGWQDAGAGQFTII